MKKIAFVAAICLLTQISCRVRSEDLKAKADKILDDIGNGVAQNDFPDKYFPKDQTATLTGQLKDYCDFKNRRGNFINEFREKSIGGTDKTSEIYEFI